MLGGFRTHHYQRVPPCRKVAPVNLSDAAPHIQTLLDLDAHLVPCYLRDGRKPPVRGHDQKQPWTGTAQAFLKTGAKLVGIVPRSVGVVAFDSDKPGGREKCKELHGEPLAEYKTHRADGWHLLYPAPTGKVDATWEYGEIRCDVAQGYIIAWDTKQWCKAAQHIWDTAANLASSVDEIVSGNKTDTKFPATKLLTWK